MNAQRLVDMVNQIAASVPDQGHAADQTAAHLRTFWAPSMRESLAAYAAKHPEALSATALDALSILQARP